MSKPLRLGFGDRPDSHGVEKDSISEIQLSTSDGVLRIEATSGFGTPILTIHAGSSSVSFINGSLNLSGISVTSGISGTISLNGRVDYSIVSTVKGNQTGNVTFSVTGRPFQSVVLTGATATREYVLSTASTLKSRMTISAYNNAGGARTVNFRNSTTGGTVLHTLSLANANTVIADFVYNGAAWCFCGANTYAGDVKG